MQDLRDLRSSRMYVQDVLGIKSFLASSDSNSDLSSEVSLEVNAETVQQDQNFVVRGGESPRVLFLRAKTLKSVFEGELGELYKKILQSLKRSDKEIATIEWTSGSLSAVLGHIQNTKPQLIFALGQEADNFVLAHQGELSSYIVIKSCDPEQVQNSEELKRKLWNDLKTLIKHLELA